MKSEQRNYIQITTKNWWNAKTHLCNAFITLYTDLTPEMDAKLQNYKIPKRKFSINIMLARLE